MKITELGSEIEEGVVQDAWNHLVGIGALSVKTNDFGDNWNTIPPAGIQARFSLGYDAHYPDASTFANWAVPMRGSISTNGNWVLVVGRMGELLDAMHDEARAYWERYHGGRVL